MHISDENLTSRFTKTGKMSAGQGKLLCPHVASREQRVKQRCVRVCRPFNTLEGIVTLFCFVFICDQLQHMTNYSFQCKCRRVQKNSVPRFWFEPATFCLQGRCSTDLAIQGVDYEYRKLVLSHTSSLCQHSSPNSQTRDN